MKYGLSAAVVAVLLVGCSSENHYAQWKKLDVVYASQVPIFPGAEVEDAMGGNYYGESLDQQVSESMTYWFKIDPKNHDQIVAYNDAELSGLSVGEQIIIPNGSQPAPAVTHTTSYSAVGFAWGSGALYGGNGYDYGYCTWWAAQQRLNHGLPMPTNLGDAWSWKYRAPSAGLSVSSTPVAGAIIWFPMAYPGHVGFVEAVNADGSITISEMNMRGWGVVDRQTIPASQVGNYSYIN